MGDHCYWLSDSTSIILWNLTACSLRSQKKLKLKKRSWDFVFGIILRSPWGRRPSLWGCQSPSSNSRFQHSFASSIYPGSPGCSPSPVQVTCSEPQAAFDPKNTQIGFAESECVWLWFRFQFECEWVWKWNCLKTNHHTALSEQHLLQNMREPPTQNNEVVGAMPRLSRTKVTTLMV